MKSRAKNRTIPYDIHSVPGYPKALKIYRIPASKHWQVRYFFDGKYRRRSTDTENKSEAISKAKELFNSVRLAEKLDQHTFASAARRFLEQQACRTSEQWM